MLLLSRTVLRPQILFIKAPSFFSFFEFDNYLNLNFILKKTLKNKLQVAIVLLILGLIGVFSLLTMEAIVPEIVETAIDGLLTTEQTQFLLLINPIFYLFICVVIGTLLYDKVKLELP
ncbi:MAG: hypothetical protein AAFQ20_09255, partial [Bacteroidota bacterium]